MIEVIDDEAILAAIGALMDDVTWKDDQNRDRVFKTKSRRVRMFSEVSSDQQPACFQAEWSTNETQVTGLPYKTTLEVNWIVYQCVGKDKKAIPARENNRIITAIRRALAPKPSDPGYPDERNTLGGLVHHCFINGRIFKDAGDIDDQGMMVVPIKLLVP